MQNKLVLISHRTNRQSQLSHEPFHHYLNVSLKGRKYLFVLGFFTLIGATRPMEFERDDFRLGLDSCSGRV